MTHSLPISLLVAASTVHAGWVPDSPLLQVGDNLDVYFTLKGKATYDSNIFLGSSAGLPPGGLYWSLGPGFDIDFAKESNFSASVSLRRDYVNFLDSAQRGLDDQRDNASVNFSFDTGGPLTISGSAGYVETATNGVQEAALTGLGAEGTLSRQATYSHSATIGYRFTDKLNASLGATRSSNRYDPFAKPIVAPAVTPTYNTQGLTENTSWTFPLDIRFQIRERLNIGFAWEHGWTDIKAATLSTAPLTYTGFTKDFYGVTLTGQPTPSGKINLTLKAGSLSTKYDGGADQATNPSYSMSVSHTMTDKTSHSLTLTDDASVAASGKRSTTRSTQYGLNYVYDESFRAALTTGYSDTVVEPSLTVRTATFGLNATYSPDTHWTYTVGYSLTRSLAPSVYGVNQLSVEANLRW